jgi:beta-galactosidase
MADTLPRTLGVCYYPEHWPEEVWADDARRMVEAGLTWVRIGEFAWSRLEPQPGQLDFGWLDRAIDVLGAAGLKVVMGTPTATPPRWMIAKHPDMLALDENAQPRGFGSRRHYCFSHAGYLEECRRIVTLLAERYGANSYVAAWQTDNEYGCHETVVSYSKAARAGFQDWCAQTYQSPDALNRAWGNVFWSMEYAEFSEIELPNLTVTQANPSHILAFRRYSSDMVVRFNRAQAEILRKHSQAPLIHNYMCRILSFDHYDVAADLDIASWDSYPLGYLLDRLGTTEAEQKRYVRQGHPDAQAFHHDLYRSVGQGRLWVMEQQPGPVNWAGWNLAPLDGMPRLWTWEAFAHGAEAVCYFRWRQAPFAQEQMHAGLLRPDSADAPAIHEAAQISRELAEMSDAGTAQAKVALVFDYPSSWAWEALPQGEDFDYFALVFDTYKALRRAGHSIDILPSSTSDFEDYKLVLLPGILTLSDNLQAALDRFDGTAIVGPRSGSRTPDFTIPTPMPPNLPGLDVTTARVESLPPFAPMALENGHFIRWFEHLEGSATVTRKTTDGRPAMMSAGKLHYLAGWPDEAAFDAILVDAAKAERLEVLDLPEGLRVRDTGTHRFVFNYAPEVVTYDGTQIPPAGVHWHEI